MLLHDANLDRTSDGTGPVADRTLHELRQLDFSSWKGARIPDEYGGRSDQFLTLPELLVLLRGAAGRSAWRSSSSTPAPTSSSSKTGSWKSSAARAGTRRRPGWGTSGCPS